jgi:SAM-dependent methyltransferase
MFNIEFLKLIREYEFNKIVAQFSPSARILELGGGTGYQARRLTEFGFSVESLDVAESNYASQQEFPVRLYDGINIPFEDSSFDIVFSSNVLEHVRDLPGLHAEIRRVLRPHGICVHVMPTGVWRFWTSLAHYVEMIQQIGRVLPTLVPTSLTRRAYHEVLVALKSVGNLIIRYAVVPRHGESGNAITEVVTFSSGCWQSHFRREKFRIKKLIPIGIFYTGHMLLGARLSMASREFLARWLGSACVIYVMRGDRGE